MSAILYLHSSLLGSFILGLACWQWFADKNL